MSRREDGPRVRLYSRPDNDLTHRFPLIVDAWPACARVPASSMVKPWLAMTKALPRLIRSVTTGLTTGYRRNIGPMQMDRHVCD
jgi:hypothetical protein